MSTTDTFTCDRCGGTFEKAWSEEEALAEMHALFGPVPSDQQAVVCEDCWQEIERLRKAEGIPLELYRWPDGS